MKKLNSTNKSEHVMMALVKIAREKRDMEKVKAKDIFHELCKDEDFDCSLNLVNSILYTTKLYNRLK